PSERESSASDQTLEQRPTQAQNPADPATHGGTILTGGATMRQTPEGPPLVDIPGYEVLEELGHGGMGVVYKARQLKANRLVALKMILGGQHGNLEDKIRFQIEAEAIAQLVHPNIVQ